jgi:hypothetical protein
VFYDDELKDSTYAAYSRTITSLMQLFYTLIHHGYQQIEPLFYFDAPTPLASSNATLRYNLPIRLLHACIRHPLANVMHYYIAQTLCLLLQGDHPEKVRCH